MERKTYINCRFLYRRGESNENQRGRNIERAQINRKEGVFVGKLEV